MLAHSAIQYLIRRLLPSRLSVVASRLDILKPSRECDTLETNPLVSIVIPTRDKVVYLKACIESIQRHTSYSNYEIVVLDNGSVEDETLTYLQTLIAKDIRVIALPGTFNYSYLCNTGIRQSKGQVICLLNNDTEITTGDWLSRLASHALIEENGIVGVKMSNTDGSLQNAGLVLGYRGIAGSPARIMSQIVKSCPEVSGVTFACAVFRKSIWTSVGPLDEKLAVGLNDVDYCIRSLKAGYKNVICGQTEIKHIEYGSRPKMATTAGAFKALREIVYFLKKHPTWFDSEQAIKVTFSPF